MVLKEAYTEELIYLRQLARDKGNYLLSDKIRLELDSRYTFVFDSAMGQIVYYELEGMTRSKLIDKINKDLRLEKLWDARLYTLRRQMNK